MKGVIDSITQIHQHVCGIKTSSVPSLEDDAETCGSDGSHVLLLVPHTTVITGTSPTSIKRQFLPQTNSSGRDTRAGRNRSSFQYVNRDMGCLFPVVCPASETCKGPECRSLGQGCSFFLATSFHLIPLIRGVQL